MSETIIRTSHYYDVQRIREYIVPYENLEALRLELIAKRSNGKWWNDISSPLNDSYYSDYRADWQIFPIPIPEYITDEDIDHADHPGYDYTFEISLDYFQNDRPNYPSTGVTVNEGDWKRYFDIFPYNFILTGGIIFPSTPWQAGYVADIGGGLYRALHRYSTRIWIGEAVSDVCPTTLISLAALSQATGVKTPVDGLFGSIIS